MLTDTQFHKTVSDIFVTLLEKEREGSIELMDIAIKCARELAERTDKEYVEYKKTWTGE